jgi:cob(I)alamin adenosyltransferase
MTDRTDHKVRMQRLKASVDRRIAAAQEERGLLIVYTGSGKGKTTAALGMAVRCIGHGMKVAVVQFIKGAIDTAEERVLKSFGDQITFLRMGEGYTWETQDRERDTEFAQRAWAVASSFIRDPAYAMVILASSISPSIMGMCSLPMSCRYCGTGRFSSMWSSPDAAPNANSLKRPIS